MKRMRAGAPRRLATALVLALAFATPAAAERITREAAAEELDAIPLYQVLAKHYPAVHAQVLDGLVQGINGGRPYRTMIADLNAVVVKLVTQQAPKANIENTLALLKLTRDQAKVTLARDPAGCLSVLGVREYDIAAVRALPEDLTQREMSLMTKVLEQTAVAPETPAVKIDEKALEAIALDAYDRLPDDRLRVAFGEIGGDPAKAKDPLSQTAFCEFSIAMFDILLAMPPIEGAQNFRGLNALGEAAAATP
jgi:hypothetical protein